jgi:hypothetical protein
MKKEIVSQSTSQEPARKMRGALRPVATLMAVSALIALASSSALAEGLQLQPVQFKEDGAYPATVYVYAATSSEGATILATMGNYFVPANPTHGANCSPTGTTFVCGGTFAVFVGEHKYFKAIACKVGRIDSVMTSYEVDNSGN